MNENDVDRDPDVRYRFRHSLRAPSQARQELDAVFAEPDDPIADDVRVTTSELVTNVVMHTDDGGELRVWDPRPDAPLRIEVEDDDRAPAEIPSTPPLIGGRGLLIVDAIADRWGVDPTQRGKVVWAEFDRIGAHPNASTLGRTRSDASRASTALLERYGGCSRTLLPALLAS